MKKFLLITLVLIFSMIVYIQMQDKAIARRYLSQNGYVIVRYNGNEPVRVLTKNEVRYGQAWMLQKIDPGQFLGKEICYEGFTVKNHPLDNWKRMAWGKMIQKSKGETNIMVFLSDHKVIGGISVPVLDSTLLGGAWSLEGKEFEEVHPEVKLMGYPKWSQNWQDRYK